VLLGVVLLGTAALLAGTLRGRKLAISLAIVALTAAVNLALLFPVAKRSGIEVVKIPAGSQVAQIFPTVDYADAYRASLPAGRQHDSESVTRVVFASLLPCWTSQAERDRLKAALENATFQPGKSLGGWKAYAKAPQEIVVGADQPHLDFRVSVFLDEGQGVQRVTVSTVVRYNNWMGRAYFVPVRVGHQIIVPHAVRTAAYNLRQPDK